MAWFKKNKDDSCCDIQIEEVTDEEQEACC
ncbi:hypothetical protein SAMN05877753_109126 [Bacillus oleivorans]|uniref:Uncharacterized protein n=1 Tax=Bacillus oleivorans TaxID=1448271 RepID=A0A285D539_9BACI|nr:hypothetical protein SAMN05877753_109126 [Bacillus oleivorans]